MEGRRSIGKMLFIYLSLLWGWWWWPRWSKDKPAKACRVGWVAVSDWIAYILAESLGVYVLAFRSAWSNLLLWWFLLGWPSFGGLIQSLRRRTSRLISEHRLQEGQTFWGVAFPLIKYVYNTKARCYLNIFPHFQILSLGPPAFFNRLKQDLGKIYSAKF